ncbi:glutaredoxin family protein [Ectobacillus ponti]|uniref:Glutaredoxin family protein n=1 Tax=Ectobacillus ponti TaxID=2961894 RepID=A0AA42BQE2_9BACI|nr:glutaredoxin family protein [Ectobacillus ponti]MCP8970210.1 glutaredoxin family protein [Ectobacillus ponti]
MNQVTVYTTSICPMVKNLLQEQGIPFREVNVQRDAAAARKLVATTGQMGVPQTEMNGQWVIGFDPDAIVEALQKEWGGDWRWQQSLYLYRRLQKR